MTTMRARKYFSRRVVEKGQGSRVKRVAQGRQEEGDGDGGRRRGDGGRGKGDRGWRKGDGG